MSVFTKRLDDFLVYVDDMSAIHGVLDRIIEWAQAGQAKVTLAGVVESLTPWTTDARGIAAEVKNELANSVTNQLTELSKTLMDSNLDVSVKVYQGDPATVLVQAALQEEYDLLLKAHNPVGGRFSRALSSIDRRLLRACPCPIAILRPQQPDHAGRILAAVNYDPDQKDKRTITDNILAVATRAALAGFRELHILHVWSLYGESSLKTGFARVSAERLNELLNTEEKAHQDWLNALVKEFLDEMGSETAQHLAPKVYLMKGNPKQVIQQQVEQLKPDLLVIGSVARTGLPGLTMGNTAEAILNEVECSVATVKPAGFKSPIRL